MTLWRGESPSVPKAPVAAPPVEIDMDTPITEPSFDGQRWSNAEADRVELADADPRWPQRFREESRRIAEALQLPGLVIEHIG